MIKLKDFLTKTEAAGLFVTPFTIAKETGISRLDIEGYISGATSPSDTDTNKLLAYMDRIMDLIEHERFLNYINSHQIGGC